MFRFVSLLTSSPLLPYYGIHLTNEFVIPEQALPRIASAEDISLGDDTRKLPYIFAT
jgi:hypothetical protein